MSHVVVRSIPFATRVTKKHAQDIIAHDKARAQKLLQGLHPHGPKVFFEARRHRHHHGHHGHEPAPPGGGGADPTDPGTTPSGDAGVDVTDAGVTYTASVGVGSPPTQYTLLIDTGMIANP